MAIALKRATSRFRLATRAVVAAMLLSPTGAGAAGDLNLTAGFRFPERTSSVDPRGTHPEASIDISFGRAAWPVWIHAYAAGARDEYLQRIDNPSNPPGFFYAQFWIITIESGLGANKTWTVGRVHPYVAGGVLYLTQMKGQTYGPEEFAYEHGVGGWVGAGAFTRLGSHMNLGVSARYSAADADDGSPAGGAQLGLLLGWGWPAARSRP